MTSINIQRERAEINRGSVIFRRISRQTRNRHTQKVQVKRIAMRHSETDYDGFSQQRTAFNCYADELVNHLPELVIDGVVIRIISIMRDFECPKQIRYHEHPNFELTMNDRGRFENYAEDARNVFTPKTGFISLLPGGILHSRKYCAPLTINTTFHFYVDHSSGGRKDFSTALEKYLIARGCKIPIDPGTRLLYDLVFGRKNQLFQARTDIGCHLIQAFLSGLLEPVFQAVKTTIPTVVPIRSSSPDELVSGIKVLTVKYMNAKFMSRELLWSRFHLSSNYLNRIFRRKTGMSIRHYWQQQRLVQIRKLIEDTDTPFNDIARTMAFKNPAQFSKFVRQHFDHSPSELRKRKTASGALSGNTHI